MSSADFPQLFAEIEFSHEKLVKVHIDSFFFHIIYYKTTLFGIAKQCWVIFDLYKYLIVASDLRQTELNKVL